MSRERMEDLLAALRANGWRLLSESEHPSASPDPFKLEDDAVTWAVMRCDAAFVVELKFHAFGDLGQRTVALRDVLYCQVVGTGGKLYFDKRTKPEWSRNLMKFVKNLDVAASDRKSTRLNSSH